MTRDLFAAPLRACVLVSALLAGGCSMMGGPEVATPAPGAVAGAIVGAPAKPGAAKPGAAKPVATSPVATSPVAASPVIPAALPEQAPDGVLAGALGSKMTEADRKAAYAAQETALTSGQRKTWRGAAGSAYGYVEVGPEAPGLGGNCRSYTHTIFFAGRPQSASGQSCKGADGGWRAA